MKMQPEQARAASAAQKADGAKKTCVYMFVDALGWEIAQRHKFLADALPFRERVKMQFGYSSTAVPTILSGVSPSEHGHFSFFYYDPARSPFKPFKYVKYFFGAGLHPRCLTNRGRVRRLVSRLTAKLCGYTGYFQLYGLPYDKLPYFDYCEKTDIFARGGLAPVKNLRDVLEESGVKFHISDWRKSEAENMDAAESAIAGGVDFAFVYTADFDSFLHDNVFDESAISERLKSYESKVKRLMGALEKTGRPHKFTVISDHGMTPLKGTADLRQTIASAKLKFGRDFACVLDSTMARFWYLKDGAEAAIRGAFGQSGLPGAFVTDEEKRAYGIDFPMNRFGDDIFLMDAGVQISPSDMGAKALNGMHGFSPEDADSYACMLSTEAPATPPKEVKDFFRLMKADIGEAWQGGGPA